jgi:Ca2+/Na+ antiporter
MEINHITDHRQLITSLGRAGLIPFVVLALMVWLLINSDLQPFVAMMLACYAALIVSFLGGIHWGAVWSQSLNSAYANECKTRSLWWGITVSLLAWVGVLIPVLSSLSLHLSHGKASLYELQLQAKAGLIWLGLLLAICYLVDRKMYPRIGLQPWLSLRFHLSSAATLSCFLAAGAL